MMKAEDLKNSILQMAMQGKIVPQDPDDEPASVLLEKIKQEKEQLIKDKKIKRNNKESSIWKENGHWYEKLGKTGETKCIDEEIPFEIPKSWSFVRFGSLTNFNIGKTPPRKEPIYWENAIIPWVSIADMKQSEKIYETKEKITEYALENKFKNQIVKKGTLIMSFKLTVGKTSILGMNAVHNEAIISIYPYLNEKNYTRNYLFYLLPLISITGDTKSAIKGKTLNSKSLNNLLISLPPLHEQKRIVEKLEQILPQIEQYAKYEEQLTKLNKEFPDKLKKSILQQAIQGKLVPQNPNDEPASMLLEKIKQEKEQLIKDKKIKRNNKESTIWKENGHWYEKIGKNGDIICIDTEIPFNIPKNWVWIKLENITTIVGDGLHGTPDYDGNGEYYFINGNNLNNGKIIFKDTTKRINFYEYDKYKKPLNENTVLVSINGTIGNVAFYNNERVMLGKSACFFNLIKINKYYIKEILRSNYFLKYALENATGTTIKNVSLKTIKKWLVPIPPLNEQKRIVEKLEQILPQIEQYQKYEKY